MDTVYKSSRNALHRKESRLTSWALFLWEYKWRFVSKHSNVLLISTLTLIILGVFTVTGIINLPSLQIDSTAIGNPLSHSTQPQTENAIGKGLAQFINYKFSGIIAFILGIFSLFRLLSISLIPGSSRASKEFMELSNNMNYSTIPRLKYVILILLISLFIGMYTFEILPDSMNIAMAKAPSIRLSKIRGYQ